MSDFIGVDDKGRGIVNILAADKLMASPKLYATFLLWLMSELFEHLLEVGDPDKPVLAFFFDEAHLLFGDAPKALLEKIEQVVRLIRSKGVGVCFLTQNPIDILDTVAGQLGSRVQHALRAFTPRGQAAVKSAATTFPRQSRCRCRKGDHRVEGRRSPGLAAPARRRPRPGRAHADKAARLARRPGHSGRARRDDPDRSDRVEIRHADRPRIGRGDPLRQSQEASAAAAEAAAKTEADKAAALQAKEDARAAKEAERQRIADQREADRQAKLAAQQQKEAERAAANSPGTAPSPPPPAPLPRRSAGRSRTKCRKRCSAHRAVPARASSAGWCAGSGRVVQGR